MEWLTFVIVAACAIATAVGLVVRPNPLHGALFLVGNLFCVSVLYLLLGAEFLAFAQVIVYAGAIMVLFVFAIMMLIPARAEEDRDVLRSQRRLAVPIGGLLGLIVAGVLGRAARTPRAPTTSGTVETIGRLLFTDYLVPFEVTSLLLLAALVGALALAKRRAS